MSQNDSSSSRVKAATIAAIITGIFVVTAACVSGGVLLVNTLFEKEVIIIPQSPTPTTLREHRPEQPTVECIHPQELARQKGWTDKGRTTDKWGGWYVELSQPDELPAMWEALGERHISN